jgi:hypothetical protein
MNRHHLDTELIRGRLYRYDADFDTWYPVQHSESTVSKWAWIPVTIVLALVCYLVSD